MLKLKLLAQRNATTLAFTFSIVLFVAVITGIALTPSRAAMPLGDPNAPVPEATAAPLPDNAMQPVSRPGAVPISNGGAPDDDPYGGVVQIDEASLRPAPQAASRLHAAIACAAGRDLHFDPSLDAAAAELWYIETVYNNDFSRLEQFIRDYDLAPRLKTSTRIPGVVVANLNQIDPCVVGDVDLRAIFSADDFAGIDAAGVALFPVPGFETAPVASFTVILLDLDAQ